MPARRREWLLFPRMRGVAATHAAVGAVTLALLAPVARAGDVPPVPAAPQTASLDSEAPAGAPPHWLPDEEWVMQHWLPYDETRLYDLLGVSRSAVFNRLRDDTHNLAELAQEHGWELRALANALVAPWRGRLKEPHRLAVLEKRALATLTQGHLAQHVFFHSLHQNAIPDNAPAIFGVASRDQFQLLRRSELSPVQICRLNGLPAAHAEREAERTLRAMAARAVEGQAMPASQARRLLRRQLRQLPRWLHQTRYNGPPPLVRPRASAATASNYSNNAVLSADGSRVVWEAYEAQLAAAKSRGEINVLARSLARATPALVSAPLHGALRDPRSSYNPSVSVDGRYVAYESAQGNLNFAKRYGKMAVFVRDTRRGTTVVASPDAEDSGRPRSSYGPSISGDGRRVAFESYDAGGLGTGTPDVLVVDLPSRRVHTLRADDLGLVRIGEPRLSSDGSLLVLTGARPGEELRRVLRYDLRTRRLVEASDGAGDAYEPEISATGRWIAHTELSSGRTRVVARDLRSGRATVVAPRRDDGLAADAAASDAALSADGRFVAFVARGATDRRGSVYVRDLRAQTTRLVSRASGPDGAPADGGSAHPSISADGRYVTFTSDAWNLSENKCNAARGVFVRDLETQTTALLSSGDGANRYLGPTKGSSQASDMTISLVCG